MNRKDFTIYQTPQGVALRAHTERAVVWAWDALPPSVVPRLSKEFTRRDGGVLALGKIDPVSIVLAISEAGLEYDVLLRGDE